MLLNEEALRERLARLQAQIPQRSLMEVKAEMIALILENAQLPVREDGYFVARFGNLGIMEALRKQLRKEVCQEKAAHTRYRIKTIASSRMILVIFFSISR